jgi:hypothetical protein
VDDEVTEIKRVVVLGRPILAVFHYLSLGKKDSIVVAEYAIIRDVARPRTVSPVTCRHTCFAGIEHFLLGGRELRLVLSTDHAGR